MNLKSRWGTAMSDKERNHLAIKMIAELHKRGKRYSAEKANASSPADYIIACRLKDEISSILDKVLELTTEGEDEKDSQPSTQSHIRLVSSRR